MMYGKDVKFVISKTFENFPSDQDGFYSGHPSES